MLESQNPMLSDDITERTSGSWRVSPDDGSPIIGDVMLDRYFRGTVSRISPEAPVPIVDIEEESEHPGGAANVATTLSSSAHTRFCSASSATIDLGRSSAGVAGAISASATTGC